MRVSPEAGSVPSEARAEASEAPYRLPFSLEDDTDYVANELEEFYSYVEAPLVVENGASWHAWATSKWSSMRIDQDIAPGST